MRSACSLVSQVTKTITLSVICCYDLHDHELSLALPVGARSLPTNSHSPTSGLRLKPSARWVKRRSASPTLLVGYDTRFASEHFGREVARVLSSQNIRVRLCSQAVPTPAVACTVIKQKLDGAINITASHNPGEYNGLKFSTSDGAPALPEVTGEVEKEIEHLQAALGIHRPSRMSR